MAWLKPVLALLTVLSPFILIWMRMREREQMERSRPKPKKKKQPTPKVYEHEFPDE